MNAQAHTESRLQHFPVSFFAIIMGLSGLTIALKKVGVWVSPGVGLVLGYFTSAVMVLITATYLLKLIRHPKAVLKELRHPIRLNFFAAFSISLLLLAIVWHERLSVCKPLWMAGAVIHILITLYVMSSWLNHTHYELAHANPSWFIPVVGNILVPIVGVQLGYMELSWFFFSVGALFWIVLLTIVLYRLFFHDPLPTRLVPMLFIFLAPPSIGFISYTMLVGGLDGFARVLYYVALFLGMLLFSNGLSFLKLPYFISSWAYSFPVASLTIATGKMASLTGEPLFHWLANGLLTILSALLIWLVVKTAVAIRMGDICKPE